MSCGFRLSRARSEEILGLTVCCGASLLISWSAAPRRNATQKSRPRFFRKPSGETSGDAVLGAEDVIRSGLPHTNTSTTERRTHGTLHYYSDSSRIEEAAEAETEAGTQVVADAERGTQGQAGRARGKAGGRDRSIKQKAHRRRWAFLHRIVSHRAASTRCLRSPRTAGG